VHLYILHVHGALKERLCSVRQAHRVIEQCKIVLIANEVAPQVLPKPGGDVQRPDIEWLRRRLITALVMKQGKIVETTRHIRVGLAERLFEDDDRAS
jgi:hypothetical protein